MPHTVEVVTKYGPWAHVAISYLKEQGGEEQFVAATASEMARRFGVAITTFSRPLQDLIRDGIVEVEGRSRSTKYKLAPKPKPQD